MIRIFDLEKDAVILSAVASGKSDYRYALDALYPLLDRFSEQRKSQSKKFYSRLKKDILKGCIMPPLTLAFVSPQVAESENIADVEEFINENIQHGYILDGMQRLNTLYDASYEDGFDCARPIYLNIVIAKRYDLLLYRMITLNNGQKPMTARHQIEMLTSGAIDTENLNIRVITEKETENSKPQGAFKQADIVEAYIAFLSDNVNNQNSKIIESKLDEILVGRVMDSNLMEQNVSFSDVLKQVDRFSVNADVKEWLRISNNLIGFTVGSKSTIETLDRIDPEKMAELVDRFDRAFAVINPSRVNVGKYRRELSRFYFENIAAYTDADVEEVEEAFIAETQTE